MPAGAVLMWSGFPGSGKSYSMVWNAVIKRLLAPKTRFFTNMYPLDLPGDGPIYYLRDVADLLAARDGIVLIDEANLFFPSRLWRQIPTELLDKLSQVRKDDLELWFSTQNAKRVDTVLRDLVSRHFWMRSFQRIGFFVAKVFVDDSRKQAAYQCWSFVLFNRKRVAMRYRHKEKIAPPVFTQGKTSVLATSAGEMERLRIDRPSETVRLWVEERQAAAKTAREAGLGVGVEGVEDDDKAAD